MTEVDTLHARYLREDQENNDFVMGALLQTAQGRKWLYQQLADCKVGQQPFTTNTLQLSFNCGELNAGQRLLAQILDRDPDGYVLMLKEAQDERRKRDEQLAAAIALSGTDG